MTLPPSLEADVFTLEGQAGWLQCYRGGPGAEASLPPMLLLHSVNAVASAQEVRPVFEWARTTRPVYAFDLPGYGGSERSNRPYTARLMTDALLEVVKEVQRRHPGAAIDGLGLSLGTEFLARAALELPGAFRSLALVSPTGFSGSSRFHGPSGSTREMSVMVSLLLGRPWGPTAFRWLTKPSVIRYFLERTWGGKTIDEKLFQFDVLTAQAPGAHFAPLTFLTGRLFSKDINTVYEALREPVWMSHGVRGDFVDYRGKDSVAQRPNWSFTTLETGALPYFERPAEFFAAYEKFLATAG